MIRKFAFAAASLLALALLAPQAEAANVFMCGANLSSQTGPRTIGGSGSAVPSGTLYILNSRQCALIAQGDVGYFQSQGFVQDGALQSYVFTTGVLTSTTAVQLPSLPASAYIREIIVDNSTANAVTGGIDIGTTSTGNDVVSALTCGANCLTFVGDVSLLKRVFSKTVAQALYIFGHTAGNSANLNVTVVYGYF